VTEIDNLTEPKAANVFEAVRVQDEGIRYQRLVYRSNDSGVGRISDHTLPFGRVGDILTNNPIAFLIIPERIIGIENFLYAYSSHIHF
jgi:hypothetical protein